MDYYDLNPQPSNPKPYTLNLGSYTQCICWIPCLCNLECQLFHDFLLVQTKGPLCPVLIAGFEVCNNLANPLGLCLRACLAYPKRSIG